MEELNKLENKTLELWNPKVAFGFSLLFTPIFSVWIHAKNWKALGKKDEAKKSIFWLYGMIIFIVGISIILPQTNVEPTLFIGLIWFFTDGNKQVKYLEDNHINYKKKSWKKVIIIPLLIIYIPIIFFIILNSLTNKNNNLFSKIEKKSQLNQSKKPFVTFDKYKKLKNGMSYKEVVSILGSEGIEKSNDGNTIAYEWINNSIGNILVFFQNDRLYLKSQFGLK